MQQTSPVWQLKAEVLRLLVGHPWAIKSPSGRQIPPFPVQSAKPPSSSLVFPVNITKRTITTTSAMIAPMIIHQILASPFFIVSLASSLSYASSRRRTHLHHSRLYHCSHYSGQSPVQKLLWHLLSLAQLPAHFLSPQPHYMPSQKRFPLRHSDGIAHR